MVVVPLLTMPLIVYTTIVLVLCSYLLVDDDVKMTVLMVIAAVDEGINHWLRRMIECRQTADVFLSPEMLCC